MAQLRRRNSRFLGGGGHDQGGWGSVVRGGPGPDHGICYIPDISGAVAGVTLVLTSWGRKCCLGVGPGVGREVDCYASVTEDPFPCL